MPNSPPDFDVILAGGGLANCLIASQLLARRPDLRLCVIESGPVLGGNHTWSFHDGDVSPEVMTGLKPFITASWARQSVHFPGHSRVFDVAYHSISSEKLHFILSPALGRRLLLGAEVTALTPDSVTLADQRVLTARCVIDGRGPDRDAPLALGFQKFVGLEVETEVPHGETVAVIMDAAVPQLDGYRFVYTLPFSPTRILIEDTYYSDGAGLNGAQINARIQAYAAAKGWRIARVVREEKGVLPVVLAGDIDAFWRAGAAGVPRVGLRAAVFHPTTGYSLPDAAELAARLVASSDWTSAGVRSLVEDRSRALWNERGFFRLLNRMLFLAATPAERVGVLERFYRLPGPLIERFFAAKLTLADQARILAGRPPVPISKALSVIGEAPAWAFARRRADSAP